MKAAPITGAAMLQFVKTWCGEHGMGIVEFSNIAFGHPGRAFDLALTRGNVQAKTLRRIASVTGSIPGVEIPGALDDEPSDEDGEDAFGEMVIAGSQALSAALAASGRAFI